MALFIESHIYTTYTKENSMGIVEIFIKNDKVYKIAGSSAYVFVHDNDVAETTTMVFRKKQEEYYDNNKNTGHTKPKITFCEEDESR